MRRQKETFELSRNQGIGKSQGRVYNSDKKVNARQAIVQIYRENFGISIPADRQYWTLCHFLIEKGRSLLVPKPNPRNDPGLEINQMASQKLLNFSQFHGINRNSDITRENKIYFPEAHWHHGEWINVIRKEKENDRFNPSIVYFDTFNLSINVRAAQETYWTMIECPKDTLFAVNLMLKNPYRSFHTRFNVTDFMENMQIEMSRQEFLKWRQIQKVYKYEGTSRTEMATYFFCKEKS